MYYEEYVLFLFYIKIKYLENIILQYFLNRIYIFKNFFKIKRKINSKFFYYKLNYLKTFKLIKETIQFT